MSEAEDEAARVWEDIIVFGGAGTFTPEQEDGYAKGLIAAAIQKHMDEEEKLSALCDQAGANWERWKKAAWAEQQRAERAEAAIDDLSRELTEEIEAHRVTRERATLAEQRLADLVREVGEWWESDTADAIDLSVLLRKYKQPTEVAK